MADLGVGRKLATECPEACRSRVESDIDSLPTNANGVMYSTPPFAKAA